MSSPSREPTAGQMALIGMTSAELARERQMRSNNTRARNVRLSEELLYLRALAKKFRAHVDGHLSRDAIAAELEHWEAMSVLTFLGEEIP